MSEALNARSEILARIRSALGRNTSALNVEEAWQGIPRDYRQASALDAASCIDLFIDRLHDYGAGISRCQSAQLASTIGEILHRRGKKKMLVSPDIDPAWLSESDDAIFVSDDALSYAAIDDCDGVVTGCVVGIAGTGTLALCHEAGSQAVAGKELLQCRRALTLIPDYHLCVVQASDVVETVPEAMRILDAHKTQAITLISGPSATADIEMTRIQGVHGPRVLDVVIVI